MAAPRLAAGQRFIYFPFTPVAIAPVVATTSVTFQYHIKTILCASIIGHGTDGRRAHARECREPRRQAGCGSSARPGVSFAARRFSDPDLRTRSRAVVAARSGTAGGAAQG